jgi:hypothetical protein
MDAAHFTDLNPKGKLSKLNTSGKTQQMKRLERITDYERRDSLEQQARFIAFSKQLGPTRSLIPNTLTRIQARNYRCISMT